jgi:hypothetical protein
VQKEEFSPAPPLLDFDVEVAGGVAGVVAGLAPPDAGVAAPVLPDEEGEEAGVLAGADAVVLVVEDVVVVVVAELDAVIVVEPPPGTVSGGTPVVSATVGPPPLPQAASPAETPTPATIATSTAVV